MRPLIVQVPKGQGSDVLQHAEKAAAKNVCLWSGTDGGKEIDVVMAFVSNREVETLLDALNEMEGVRITLFPQGVMALYPPNDKAPDQVTDVQPKSPVEVFLAGLQSIGSWKGF